MYSGDYKNALQLTIYFLTVKNTVFFTLIMWTDQTDQCRNMLTNNESYFQVINRVKREDAIYK